MSVLIKNMEMPKGCIYANDNDQTEYCPLLNHDDVPFCQYIESEPEIAIGIGERPVYCPLSDVPEPCENTVSRQAAIDAVMQYCPDDDGSCSKADRDIRELLDDIENLPSAQPKTQLSTEDATFDTTFDCISRQAAIDALEKSGYCYDQFLGVESVLNALPSEQPDCSDCIKHGGDWDCDHIHCHKGSDPISRRDAIDALKRDEEYDEDIPNRADGVRDAIIAIMGLPSAQPSHDCETCRYNSLEWNEEPCDSCTVGGESNHWKPKEPERKKGEWIKTPYHVTECSECGFSLEDWIQGAFYNYCPNCGADMRGEQP